MLIELMTIREASKFLRVHPNTLRNWEARGKLFPVRLGTRRDRRFIKAHLIDLVRDDLKLQRSLNKGVPMEDETQDTQQAAASSEEQAQGETASDSNSEEKAE